MYIGGFGIWDLKIRSLRGVPFCFCVLAFVELWALVRMGGKAVWLFLGLGTIGPFSHLVLLQGDGCWALGLGFALPQKSANARLTWENIVTFAGLARKICEFGAVSSEAHFRYISTLKTIDSSALGSPKKSHKKRALKKTL